MRKLFEVVNETRATYLWEEFKKESPAKLFRKSIEAFVHNDRVKKVVDDLDALKIFDFEFKVDENSTVLSKDQYLKVIHDKFEKENFKLIKEHEIMVQRMETVRMINQRFKEVRERKRKQLLGVESEFIDME